MKAKAKPRLKKGPDIQDYVVEVTDKTAQGLRQSFHYFVTRAEARAHAKETMAFDEELRVRIFRMHFTLVSDSKKRGRK